MQLNDCDRRLLELVQRDCRKPVAELASEVGLSTSSCWRRLKAFEEAGLIERYGAVVNPSRLGLGFQAIVQVQLAREDPERVANFLRAVGDRPEVVECYAITGPGDYLMRVLCSDIGAFNRFLDEFLFRMQAVRSAETHVVLQEVKRSAAVPV